MEENNPPFERGWFSQELEGYRDVERHATYHLFPYESLPPLPEHLFKGEFDWLSDKAVVSQPFYDDSEGFSRLMGRTIKRADALGVQLPPEFVRFMSSPYFPKRIRSCTDCDFETPGEIIPCSPELGGYLIRFLNDSQGVLFWHLYLDGKGGHCVVAGGRHEPDEQGAEEDDPEAVAQRDGPSARDLVYCAPGFEHFVYRFWIENEIWFAINEKRLLTQDELLYAEKCRALSDVGQRAAQQLIQPERE